MHARRPLPLLALTLLAFELGDAAIFRSGLYERVSSSETVAGKFMTRVRYGLDTPPSDKREILVLGHSKVEAALSFKQFDREHPASPLRLVVGTVPASTPKVWFYMLQHLDPRRDRYAAIVVPLDQYLVAPMVDDEENEIVTAQMVAPLLRASDWPDFVSSYTDPGVRERVAVMGLVASRRYPLDLQDLLLHPVDRYRNVTWNRENVTSYLYEWPGYDGDVSTLVVDPATGKILHMPEHLDSFRRAEAQARFTPLAAGDAAVFTDRYAAYTRRWLGRILAAYAASATRLVFLRVPRWPMPLPQILPVAGAPDVRDWIPRRANVTVLEEDAFSDLERPEDFYDVLHVNQRARAVFTRRFGARLAEILGVP